LLEYNPEQSWVKSALVLAQKQEGWKLLEAVHLLHTNKAPRAPAGGNIERGATEAKNRYGLGMIPGYGARAGQF